MVFPVGFAKVRDLKDRASNVGSGMVLEWSQRTGSALILLYIYLSIYYIVYIHIYICVYHAFTYIAFNIAMFLKIIDVG